MTTKRNRYLQRRPARVARERLKRCRIKGIRANAERMRINGYRELIYSIMRERRNGL